MMNAYTEKYYIAGYNQALADIKAEQERKSIQHGYFLFQKLVGVLIIACSWALWKILPTTIFIIAPFLVIAVAMLLTNKPIISDYPEESEE